MRVEDLDQPNEPPIIKETIIEEIKSSVIPSSAQHEEITNP